MSFIRETRVKAVRKQHRCDGCGKSIEIGQPAMRWAGMTDGDFGAAIYHPECRAAEVALNTFMGYLLGDDWWPLREIEPEDRQWLCDKHPIAAERMGITAHLQQESREDGKDR